MCALTEKCSTSSILFPIPFSEMLGKHQSVAGKLAQKQAGRYGSYPGKLSTYQTQGRPWTMAMHLKYHIILKCRSTSPGEWQFDVSALSNSPALHQL